MTSWTHSAARFADIEVTGIRADRANHYLVSRKGRRDERRGVAR